MAINISPGVYSTIIDLSTYVQEVPGTIAFIAALTKKGKDNTLKFIGSRAELIQEFGEPNMADWGTDYGQGLYEAYNYLGESGSLYFLRPLPSDASYANIRIDTKMSSIDTSATVSIAYISSLNSEAEIETELEQDGDIKPLCMLYPIGRGVEYNKLGVRITAHSNPMINGVYVLDVYEKQSDGDDVIIESFEVSFRPDALDSSGGSLYIVDVLETYSSVLRAKIGSSGYDLVERVYANEVGKVTITHTTIQDTKQDFSPFSTSTPGGDSNYVVIAKDSRGTELWGWLGDSTGNDTISVYYDRDTSISGVNGWHGDWHNFDFNDDITYEVKGSYASVAEAFISSDEVPLRYGSDGSLFDNRGNLVPSVATNLLANAYAGTIDENVLDTEFYYYTVIFDAGYPDDVKTQIVTLAQTRQDCVALVDNGNNTSFNAAITNRQQNHNYNTYLVAIYENYNKVYDIFTGKDIWVSPLYHMAYLLPRNDKVSEVWYAIAGFNRGAISNIKKDGLRFNPRLGQRDQLYLKQINSIVQFKQGHVFWSQLTSQAKPSALQDLNIVRLLLYIKKALEGYCRYFIFEHNDYITWNQIAGQVNEFLEDISKKRGLDSYEVFVGATEYQKKRKTCTVKVILTPTRVLEKIELNFYIK